MNSRVSGWAWLVGGAWRVAQGPCWVRVVMTAFHLFQ